MRARAKLAVVRTAPPTLAARLATRAYHPVYRPGEVNRCPGCGHSHWWVGRSNAECAFCAAIVPIAPDGEPLPLRDAWA